jgi:hypothetical protein
MKKLLLSFGLFVTMLTITLPANAWNPLESIISLSLTDVKPSNGYPRTPVNIPQVGQTGHTLYFHDEADFTVCLYSVDEDGERTLEYTTFVPSTTESIVLPNDLLGTYVIEVIRGEQHFEGEIEL